MGRLSRRNNRLSIRVKFALLLAIMTVIGGTSFGAVAIISTYTTTIRLIHQEYNGRVRELSAHVKEILEETSRQTLFLANSGSINEMLERSAETPTTYVSDESFNRLRTQSKELIKVMLGT